MTQRDDVMCWLDLEMTGLDPQSCRIIQLAMILTDYEFNELAPPLDLNIWQPDSVLETMTPFVRRMHEKTGLIEAVRASDIDIDEAQKQALELLSTHARYGTARLCGNSVWQDRRFLVPYMPVFDGYLHYRIIDVSALKELAGRWYGVKHPKMSDGKHNALNDIRQSIEELKFYRERVLRPTA